MAAVIDGKVKQPTAAPEAAAAGLVEEMLSHLKPANFVDFEPSSQVAKFYANRSVFITGATGFIGKALVEKLVRSCKDIKRIYILIREKRGLDIKDRLVNILESPIYNRIKSQPNGKKLLEKKLYAIKGDITMPKFGISQEDMIKLANEVSIVFNSAATIRFVEPIDVAVRNNIYSVSQLVEFCNELEKLEALIHLSTAYSNCHKRDTIYEIFYEPPMKGDRIISVLNNLKQIQKDIHTYPNIVKKNRGHHHHHMNDENDSSSKSLNINMNMNDKSSDYDDEYDEYDEYDYDNEGGNKIERSACRAQVFYKGNNLNNNGTNNGSNDNEVTTFDVDKRLMEEFSKMALRQSNKPNTYTFTKAIAESYLIDLVKRLPDRYLYDKIPVCIVRPSIVGGALREPEVGYVDNYNGPTGAILSLYMGALQAMPGEGDKVADIVPVDMVVNMITCVGWFLVNENKLNNEEAIDNNNNSMSNNNNSGVNRSNHINNRNSSCSSISSMNNNSINNLSASSSSSIVKRRVKPDKGAYIFNFVSGFRNPLYWKQVTELIADLAYKYPTNQLQRLPSSYFIKAGKFYNFYDKLNHKFPAQMQDLIQRLLFGKKLTNRTSALVNYERIRQMTKTLTPFTSNQWRLSDSNVCALYDNLNSTDKRLFEFDVGMIDWTSYISNYIIGARIYTLKDEAKNVPQALQALKIKQTFYRCFLLVPILLFHYYFIYKTELGSALIQFLLSFV